MKSNKLFILGLCLIALGGCGFLDQMLLPSATADGGSGPSVVEAAGQAASPWVPYATTVAGILTTLYASIRGFNKDKWFKSSIVTFQAIEEFLKTPAGSPIEKELKEFLARHHEAAGVYDFVKKVVAQYDH